MVNRSKKVSVSSESSEESGSSSESESDSTFAPGRARNGRAQSQRRKRQVVEDDSDSNSDSEETIAAFRRRRRRSSTGHREDLDDGRKRRRSADDCDDGRNGKGKEKKLTRRNAIVLEAVWEKNTVKITYDVGVKHACMNPVHGRSKEAFTVLHLVQCSWRKNVAMMTEAPTTKKSKSYQYCHKLCEPCLAKYGNRCFKCGPQSHGDIKPILHTVFQHETINCVEEFREQVRRWQEIRDNADVTYLVLHCTVVGPEARNIRQRFDLRRSTVIQIVYSDVRDRMEPAGSGTNLEDSVFQNVWKTTMKEKVYGQDHNLLAFFGNILLNESLSFNDFRVNDLLLMYSPSIFDSLEENAIRLSINSLQLHRQAPEAPRASPTECCLRDAVVHTHREPSSEEDDCTFQHGNLVASVFYKAWKRAFGSKMVAEVEQRAGLGEALRIGDEGHKLPFLKLYASRGGEVEFRRVASSSQDVARSGRNDPRSGVCGWDTSGFEVVCWTHRGHPKGGDFVIPGLMYRFQTSPGSTLIFRPTRYFHATLPVHSRDLFNDKFAAAFSTPT